MLKKYGWIAALFVAVAMVFVGCGGGDNGEDVLDEFLHDLGSRTLVMGDNFEYGHGYQGLADWEEIFDGQKVSVDDEYQLKIILTADRDFEKSLKIGLVDPVARGTWPDATYWHPLSWPDGGNMQELHGDDADNKLIKAGKEYTFTVDFKALAAAASNNPECNALVFTTMGACPSCNTTGPGGICSVEAADGHHEDAKGTGTKGPVTLIFSAFVFAKGQTIGEITADPITPDADMFNITGAKTQYLLPATPGVTGISVTPKLAACDGAIKVYYTGTDPVVAKSETIPSTAGVYSVTFDVAASTNGNFLAATGLSAGTLTILPEKIDPVEIIVNVTNSTAFTGTTGSADYFYFPIALPGGFDLSKYTHIKIDVKFFTDDGKSIQAPSGYHTTLKLVSETSVISSASGEWDYTKVLEKWNLATPGQQTFEFRNIPSDAGNSFTTGTIGGGTVQNGHADVKFITIEKVTFFRE